MRPVLVLLAALLAAPAASGQPAPRQYAIVKSAGGALAIESRGPGGARTLLRERADRIPERNLTGLSALTPSPDGNTLYFQTEAWATSGAVHALDLASGRERFVTAGGIVCVVPQGRFRGRLVVEKHKYFVQGGSYDALYLVDPAGKELGLVALQAEGFAGCASIE